MSLFHETHRSNHIGVPLFLMCASLIIITGCGDQNTNVILPDNPAVSATITGRVVSTSGGAAIAGATYQLVGTDTLRTTDESGLYRVEGLSEGSYQLLFSAPGFASVRFSFVVEPNSSSSSQIHLHEDVQLPAKTGSLRLSLIVGFTGNPATQAIIDVVYNESQYYEPSQQVDDPDLPLTITTDSSGMIQLDNMPAQTIDLYVRPYDVDGDQRSECATTHLELTLRPHTVISELVALDRLSEYVEIVGTNLPDYYSGMLTDPSLFFVFSREMDIRDEATEITLTQDDYPYEEVPVVHSWSSALRLEIHPTNDLTDASSRYQLHLSVMTANGVRFTRNESFYWLTSGAVPTGCDQVVTNLSLGPSNGSIDYDTRNIELQWTAVPCAGGYKIYARDDRSNPNWTLVLEEPTDYDAGTISTTCTLPESFDRYGVDGIQTPFAGIAVTLCVVPRLAANPQPGGDHATLLLRDSEPPQITDLSQVGAGLNLSEQPAPLIFLVGLNEYVSADQQPPTVEVEETGGDPDFALDPGSAVWKWDQGRRSGRVEFMLPLQANASGDRIRVRFDSLADLAGNVGAEPVFTEWMSIKVTETVFDFEGSNQGWTRMGQGWAWGTPSTGPGGAHSGTSCWATNLAYSYGTNWNTSVMSPEIFIESPSTTVSCWLWCDLGYSSDVLYLNVIVDGVVHPLAEWRTDTNDWTLSVSPLGAYQGRLIRLQFNFVSDDWDSYGEGAFVDDLVVGATPR